MNPDLLEAAIRQEMRWHIDDLLSEHRVPVFSYNQEEEKVKIKKLVKAMRRVHNYYAPHSERI